ncbi:MAG: OmpA family protein [Casimicrobium sp.]
MKNDGATSPSRWWFAVECGIGLAVVLAISGCATEIPKPTPVAAPVAPNEPTRLERIVSALKALIFEQREDGWNLSLPTPLVFPFASDVVSDDAHGNLLRVAKELRRLGISHVLVRGHTDAVGAREYNLALSKRRAEAVARVLAEGGFPIESIDAKGMGSTAPVADNGTSEGRAKNRRVVVIVQVDEAAPR